VAPTIRAVLVWFAVLVACHAPASGTQQPLADVQHLRSRFVRVRGPSLSTVTNILPPPSERVASDVQARIGLVLSSRTDRPIWLAIRLTPPSPAATCPMGVAHLRPHDEVEFRCTQEALVADVDYPMDIIVFADSARSDTLERNAMRLRFDRGTVDWIEARLASRRQEIEAGKRPIAGEPGTRTELGVGVVLALSGGVVVPTGDYSNGFGPGGMGSTSFGVTGGQFGVRLLMGSTEPRTLGPTHDAYSSRLGRRVEVMQAIVPVELQGTAAFPSRTSRLGAALQAGAGLHVVTVRLKDTDDRLDDESRFGFSTGVGVHYRITAPGRVPTMSVGLDGVFHGSGSSRYTTVELELAIVW
jgi:hypothetical protein